MFPGVGRYVNFESDRWFMLNHIPPSSQYGFTSTTSLLFYFISLSMIFMSPYYVPFSLFICKNLIFHQLFMGFNNMQLNWKKKLLVQSKISLSSTDLSVSTDSMDFLFFMYVWTNTSFSFLSNRLNWLVWVLKHWFKLKTLLRKFELKIIFF
jgi:hypothetical protein